MTTSGLARVPVYPRRSGIWIVLSGALLVAAGLVVGLIPLSSVGESCGSVLVVERYYGGCRSSLDRTSVIAFVAAGVGVGLIALGAAALGRHRVPRWPVWVGAGVVAVLVAGVAQELWTRQVFVTFGY